jgi:hypothetical protein
MQMYKEKNTLGAISAAMSPYKSPTTNNALYVCACAIVIILTMLILYFIVPHKSWKHSNWQNLQGTIVIDNGKNFVALSGQSADDFLNRIKSNLMYLQSVFDRQNYHLVRPHLKAAHADLEKYVRLYTGESGQYNVGINRIFSANSQMDEREDMTNYELFKERAALQSKLMNLQGINYTNDTIDLVDGESTEGLDLSTLTDEMLTGNKSSGSNSIPEIDYRLDMLSIVINLNIVIFFLRNSKKYKSRLRLAHLYVAIDMMQHHTYADSTRLLRLPAPLRAFGAPAGTFVDVAHHQAEVNLGIGQQTSGSDISDRHLSHVNFAARGMRPRLDKSLQSQNIFHGYGFTPDDEELYANEARTLLRSSGRTVYVDEPMLRQPYEAHETVNDAIEIANTKFMNLYGSTKAKFGIGQAGPYYNIDGLRDAQKKIRAKKMDQTYVRSLRNDYAYLDN